MSDPEIPGDLEAAVIRRLVSKAGSVKTPKKAASSAANGRRYGGMPVKSGVPADIAAQIRSQYPGEANNNLRAKLRRIYLRDGALPAVIPTRKRRSG